MTDDKVEIERDLSKLAIVRAESGRWVAYIHPLDGNLENRDARNLRLEIVLTPRGKK